MPEPQPLPQPLSNDKATTEIAPSIKTDTLTPTKKTNQRSIDIEKYKKYLAQRRSYILGVTVGLSLIVINSYIALYMLDLLLDDKQIPVVPGLSLPIIRLDDYKLVRDDHIARQEKDLQPPPDKDPFNTGL